MGGTVVILFFLPWLDHLPVQSIRYRPTWHKWLYSIFIVNFLVLGFLDTQPPNDAFNLTSQIGTLKVTMLYDAQGYSTTKVEPVAHFNGHAGPPKAKFRALDRRAWSNMTAISPI